MFMAGVTRIRIFGNHELAVHIYYGPIFILRFIYTSCMVITQEGMAYASDVYLYGIKQKSGPDDTLNPPAMNFEAAWGLRFALDKGWW